MSKDSAIYSILIIEERQLIIFCVEYSCLCAHHRHDFAREAGRLTRYAFRHVAFNLVMVSIKDFDIVGALNVTLTEEEVKYLEEPYKPMRILGHI